MGYWHSLVAKGEQENNHRETFSQMKFSKEKPDLIMASKMMNLFSLIIIIISNNSSKYLCSI